MVLAVLSAKFDNISREKIESDMNEVGAELKLQIPDDVNWTLKTSCSNRANKKIDSIEFVIDSSHSNNLSFSALARGKLVEKGGVPYGKDVSNIIS